MYARGATGEPMALQRCSLLRRRSPRRSRLQGGLGTRDVNESGLSVGYIFFGPWPNFLYFVFYGPSWLDRMCTRGLRPDLNIFQFGKKKEMKEN